METIKLTKSATGWNMTSNDPVIRELFGTDTIPTAFTANAPAALVQSEIRKLNPEAVVIVNPLTY